MNKCRQAVLTQSREFGRVSLGLYERFRDLRLGPNPLSPRCADDLIENALLWGVSTVYPFEDGVQVYAGFAQTVGRFIDNSHPVPFLARIALGKMMYELGADLLMGNEKGHPLARNALVVMRGQERDELEKRMRRSLRPMVPSKIEMKCKEVLRTYETSCFPTDAAFAERSLDNGDFELCDAFNDCWKDDFVHAEDVPEGSTAVTMESFEIPGGSVETFHHQVGHFLDGNDWVEGCRTGPSRVGNKGTIPFLNPPLEGQSVEYYLREYPTVDDWKEDINCVVGGPHGFYVVDGLWFGELTDTSLPRGKGILRFSVSSTLSGVSQSEPFTMASTATFLQYNGSMMNGEPDGLGDLTLEGHTLYSGIWKRSCCGLNGGNVLPGVMGKSFRQVLRHYMYRRRWECRLDTREDISNVYGDVLEVRVKNVDNATYVYEEVMHGWKMAATQKHYGISGHVLRLARRTGIGSAWVPFTAGCGCQDFTKVVPVVDKVLGKTRVLTCVGPRESWCEPDKYEYIVYDDNNHKYAFFEPLLAPENLVGLELVGNFSKSQKREDIPAWVGMFMTGDPRYANLVGQKWALTDLFVSTYFSRYIRPAIRNPNMMLDVIGMAAKDRGSADHNKILGGWHLDPSAPRTTPSFRFQVDGPEDLIGVVQGCVKNIYEVMYVPGGRWRFFGRFNHDLLHVTNTWFALDEVWMERYLKPQCVHDLFTAAKPFERVKVHKTGNLRDSYVKDCVKRVVLAIVPADDAAVLNVVQGWDDEQDFDVAVGRLCDLTKVSSKYQYNAIRIKKGVVRNMLKDYEWRPNDDVIIRPADRKG